MTPAQHGLLRHALGLDRRKSIDRNCLATGPGEDTYDPATGLCNGGYMVKGHPIPGGLTYYHVTEAGIAAAKLAYEEFIAIAKALAESWSTVAPTPPPPPAVAVGVPVTQPYEEE